MNKEREILIKNEYLKLIIDLGFDYDGFEESESLKGLIDTLVDYAKKALENDDKSVIFEGGGNKKFNILSEKLVPTTKISKEDIVSMEDISLKEKLQKELKRFEHVKAEPDNAVMFYKTIKKIVEEE